MLGSHTDSCAYWFVSDSWIELSSQPSSSSLSSANDEIVTTGLRVQHDSNARRRRRLRQNGPLHIQIGPRASSAGGSSQEEYEESESESDRIMMSSNKGLQQSHLRQERRPSPRKALSSASSDNVSMSDEEAEEDEDSTALDVPRPTEQCFTPQPNAFSHPPSSHANRPSQQHAAGSYFPPARPSARPSSQRHSYPVQPQHSPYNVISPSYQADHDAALRASLSTLLSCAAAARGLPKSRQAAAVPASTRIDPTSLRMVPESVALGGAPTANPALPPTRPTHRPSHTTTTTSSSPRSSSADKNKRKASASSTTTNQRSSSSTKDQRAVKKARRVSSMDEISPTLLTWVVSAGVVVLVSALSFSAGYVVGKEAGRAEVLGVGANGTTEGGRCGGEVVRSGLGLKRLRWGGAAASVRA